MSITSASVRHEYFDLAYATEPASYYYLLLELDAQELKACWYHLSKNLVTGFAKYALGTGSPATVFAKLLADHPFLKSEFKQTIVAIRSGNYALIPKGYESADHKPLFEITNAFEADNQQLFSYELVNLKASVDFALDTELAKAIQRSFFHPVIVPHVAPRIENALNLLRSGQTKDLMIAHISGEHVDVLVFQNQKLTLANSFFQSGKEDIAYYILYCAEVLGLDPEHAQLSVSGNIGKRDATWALLADYWKLMDIEQRLEHVKVSPKLEAYPGGGFDYLTHYLLCAS